MTRRASLYTSVEVERVYIEAMASIASSGVQSGIICIYIGKRVRALVAGINCIT